MSVNAMLSATFTLPRTRMNDLLRALGQRGYEAIGPTRRDGAIVYDAIESEKDLPVGLTDVQAPGKYRVEVREDAALFGFAVGPHSFKKLFLVPEEQLYRVRREGKSLRFVPESAPPGSWPCSARADATSRRSRSRIGCSWATFIQTPATPNAEGTYSSSPYTAASRRLRASVRRWARVRGQLAIGTWR